MVISQVYGGGGNTSAPYTHDYVELFNGSAAPVSVAGWSVQYSSATGTAWTAANLTPATVPAGGYLLIQMAVGAGVGAPLPTPDQTGALPLSSTSGKVALVNSTTVQTGCPAGAAIVDLVGYGTANCFEGATAAPAGSNTLAVTRSGGGCAETNVNGSDFTSVAPSPRTSATTVAPCAALPGAPATIPTMTEWAMILFGMVLAGGAALYIQRRRQFT